jgi:hypothetical protein
MADGNASSIDPTKPLPDSELQKQENKRNPSWFKPGQSGNPAGRPLKGYSITDTFKQMLGEKPEVKKALVNKILKQALDGDTPAAKMIWQYMDGMPSQSMDLTSKGESIKTPTHFMPVEVDEEPA